MMTFNVTIKLGNAAMSTQNDLSAALRKVADKLDNGLGSGGPIMDDNGNRVGSFYYEEVE